MMESIDVSTSCAAAAICWYCFVDIPAFWAASLTSSAQDAESSVAMKIAFASWPAFIAARSSPSVMLSMPLVTVWKLTCFPMLFSSVDMFSMPPAASSLAVSTPSMATVVSRISPFAWTICRYMSWYALLDRSMPFLVISASAFSAFASTLFWFSSLAFSSSVFSVM